MHFEMVVQKGGREFRSDVPTLARRLGTATANRKSVYPSRYVIMML